MTSHSKTAILDRLRKARQPYPGAQAAAGHLPVVPITDTSPEALLARFIEQAEKLGSVVHGPDSQAAATDTILRLLGEDNRVLCWPLEHVPLSGLAAALIANGIAIAGPRDPSVRVGITGADAALVATGSLVLGTGPGKHRATSLLPPVHVAVLRESQLLADLESWVAVQRKQGLDALRRLSSVMVISGPSRTADIAMQLIMGMHGPAELHIVVVED
jgi:L-lactate dehydrogenase complex protein LldG